MTVLVSNRQDLPLDEPSLASLAGRTLAAEGRPQVELSLSFVGPEEMADLHARYLGEPGPTDVLSFPLEEPGILGDVVVSIDTARRQAKEGGWPLAAELRRLLAHGILHCRGYDHESAADARRMAAAERKLLGRAGMVGPSLSGAE